MNYQVAITPRAQSDLLGIVEWISQNSPENAENWLNRLLDAIDSLATFPARCAVAPENEFHQHQVRHLLFGEYRILFSITESRVLVLHVRHGARQPLVDMN